MADAIDPVLRALVTIVNASGRSDVRVGLTVTVPGGVVSGALISEEVWLEHVAATVGSASYHTEDALDLLFSGWQQEASERNGEWNTAAKGSNGLPRRCRQAVHDAHDDPYLHVAQARIWLGDRANEANAMPQNGMAWRGRLSSVSGWAAGVLHAPGYDTDNVITG